MAPINRLLAFMIFSFVWAQCQPICAPQTHRLSLYRRRGSLTAPPRGPSDPGRHPQGPAAHGLGPEAVLVGDVQDRPGPTAGFAGPLARDDLDHHCRGLHTDAILVGMLNRLQRLSMDTPKRSPPSESSRVPGPGLVYSSRLCSPVGYAGGVPDIQSKLRWPRICPTRRHKTYQRSHG